MLILATIKPLGVVHLSLITILLLNIQTLEGVLMGVLKLASYIEKMLILYTMTTLTLFLVHIE